MLDFNAPEFLVVAVVALLVIGPKELPRALHFMGKWVGRARGVARQFRSGFDTMVREAELAELEKQWAAENERIMREHPKQSLPAPSEAAASDAKDDSAQLVEKPVIADSDRTHGAENADTPSIAQTSSLAAPAKAASNGGTAAE